MMLIIVAVGDQCTFVEWTNVSTDSCRKIVLSTGKKTQSSRYIETEQIDHNKTAFTPDDGVCKFTSIPFKLNNAPATFKRAVHVIFASV